MEIRLTKLGTQTKQDTGVLRSYEKEIKEITLREVWSVNNLDIVMTGQKKPKDIFRDISNWRRLFKTI